MGIVPYKKGTRNQEKFAEKLKCSYGDFLCREWF